MSPEFAVQPELGAIIPAELMRDITTTRQTFDHILVINSQNMAVRPHQKGNQLKDISAARSHATELVETTYAETMRAADDELEYVIAQAREKHAATVARAKQDKQDGLKQSSTTWSARMKEMNDYYKDTEQKEATLKTKVTEMLGRFNGYVVELEQGTIHLQDLRQQKVAAEEELQTLDDRQRGLQDEFVAKNAEIGTAENAVAEKRQAYQAEEQAEQRISEQLQSMRSQVSELEAGLELLQTKQDQTQQVHSIYVTTKSRLDELCKQRGQLLSELGSLAEPMVALRAHIDSLGTQISTVEQYVARLTTVINEIIRAANQIEIVDDTAERPQDAPLVDLVSELQEPVPQPVSLPKNSLMGVLSEHSIVHLVPYIRPNDTWAGEEQVS